MISFFFSSLEFYIDFLCVYVSHLFFSSIEIYLFRQRSFSWAIKES